jgi:hypothetical protein
MRCDEFVDGKLVGHVGSEAVLLVGNAAGLFAIGADCTHYYGPLAEGLVVDGSVRCPWHHACCAVLQQMMRCYSSHIGRRSLAMPSWTRFISASTLASMDAFGSGGRDGASLAIGGSLASSEADESCFLCQGANVLPRAM